MMDGEIKTVFRIIHILFYYIYLKQISIFLRLNNSLKVNLISQFAKNKQTFQFCSFP